MQSVSVFLLALKQMENDPFSTVRCWQQEGVLVNGTVTAVDAKGATIELIEALKVTSALLKYLAIVSKMHLNLSVGDSVEAKFHRWPDRKNRVISLSIKAKDEADEQKTNGFRWTSLKRRVW